MKFSSAYCHADWIVTGIKQSNAEFLIVRFISFINNAALQLRALAICIASCYTTPPWHFQFSCVGVLQAIYTHWASSICYGPELVQELYRYKIIGHCMKIMQGKPDRGFAMHCTDVSIFPLSCRNAGCCVFGLSSNGLLHLAARTEGSSPTQGSWWSINRRGAGCHGDEARWQSDGADWPSTQPTSGEWDCPSASPYNSPKMGHTH